MDCHQIEGEASISREDPKFFLMKILKFLYTFIWYEQRVVNTETAQVTVNLDSIHSIHSLIN